MSQYILFYSKKCKYSINFINILHKINARSYFTFISVDRDPRTKQRNTAVDKFQIKAVPSIFVNDQIYVGQKALLWLKKMITDMGIKGPPSMDTRQNKEGHEVNPVRNGHDDNDGELLGYDPNGDNMLSIDTNLDDTRINYITEDGNSHRQDVEGDFQLQHQSILPTDIARDLDIKLLREGTGNNREGNGGGQRKQGLKNDTLKAKQHESEYERYCRVRDSETPKARMIRN
jgi:Glutaredoxin